MQVSDIFSELYDGSSLSLTFPTLRDAENFRQLLFRYKRKHDAALEAIDGTASDTALSYRTTPTEDGSGGWLAIFSLTIKKRIRDYEVRIITRPNSFPVESIAADE